MLVRVDGIGNYRLLGESLDDAAGEAFDKVSRMLGMGYPGGPLVASLAKFGNPDRFNFPRPMLNRPGLDFSFSGLKTHVFETIKKYQKDDFLDKNDKADIAREFEEAVIETLSVKCVRALQQEEILSLVIGGGVGANIKLRSVLTRQLKAMRGRVFYPSIEFCTDNGAMIAYVGAQRISAGECDLPDAAPRARWSLEDLKNPIPA